MRLRRIPCLSASPRVYQKAGCTDALHHGWGCLSPVWTGSHRRTPAGTGSSGIDANRGVNHDGYQRAAPWRASRAARLLGGLLLFTAAVVAGLRGWRAAQTTVPVLVAARDLPAGHALADADLTTAHVRLPAGQLELAIPAADRAAVRARVLTGPLVAGELLLSARLTGRTPLAPDEVALTVGVRADSVYPRLRPGDAVTLVATRERGKPASQTTTLLARATVYAVAADTAVATLDGGSAAADDATTPRRVRNVTLVVPRAEVESVAHAAVNWDLTLALLSSATTP